MAEKIETKHPEGKGGFSIDRDKYDVIREAIVEKLSGAEDMLLQDVADEIQEDIGDTFEGSVSWYVTTVKLDLEARGIVERVSRTSPQRIRLLKKPRRKRAKPAKDIATHETLKTAKESRLFGGVVVGVCIGIAIGVAAGSIGSWMSVGALLGFVLGWLWSKP